MSKRLKTLPAIAAILTTHLLPGHAFGADETQPAAQSVTQTRAVMSDTEVVKILDATVDWYRTLGVQQQSATQPSDLLILYANRQTADKVVALAFEIARANAELLSSEAEVAQRASGDAAGSPQALLKAQQQLEARRQAIQADVVTLQRQVNTGPRAARGEAQQRLQELQSELALLNARRNLLDTMTQFAYQTDASGSGASTLKEHIDAIAASIPSSATAQATAATAGNATTSGAGASASASPLSTADESGGRRLGIWDLAANVWRLSEKISTLDAVSERTVELQNTFKQIRTSPLEQINRLSARGDALAQQTDAPSTAGLGGARDEFDTLAWLFKQTSSILIPLSKAGVLLERYQHNLDNWRAASQKQYYDALKALGARMGLLLVLLAIVFAAAELWRRTVYRYVQESRRRYQLLLVRKIVVGALVVAIVGFTFATELGSLMTFAGLITAGLAVAMQSVLVSIVGYFFLIGRYGIRVGDRVQIGTVTGEVIDLGLVRLHLMEVSGYGPTGRVVAFANSIVFQASGGIFKQMPGVDLAWHDITLTLPPDSDFSALKERLFEATSNVLKDYREDLARQTAEIQKASSSAAGEAQPQVQLRFSAENVEAVVRYPVHLPRAAEIDERVSRELLNVIRNAAAVPHAPPALSGPGA
jgi:small-conductance mechanosensitive channel